MNLMDGLEGYKYQATNYIIKPMQYVRLKSEMEQELQDKGFARSHTSYLVNLNGGE